MWWRTSTVLLTLCHCQFHRSCGVVVTGCQLAVQVNVTLEELLLDTNQVDDEAVEHIAKMLAVNKSLRVVNLGANRIGDAGAAALAEMLKSNTTLRELDLGSNEIGYDGAPPLRRSLVSPCMCAMHVDLQCSSGSPVSQRRGTG